MKFYCYTRVDGYKRFCISKFRRSDDGRYQYIFMEDIANSKLNPLESIYVTRDNLCGLSEKSARLFTYKGCKLLLKLDDGENPTGFTFLYLSNVGNAIEAARNNQSKSFAMIAETKEEDDLLRKLSCVFASNNQHLSDLIYSLAYKSILDEKVIFCFDNEKWKELISYLNKQDVPSKFNDIVYGNKLLCICEGISVDDFFAEFGINNDDHLYVYEGDNIIINSLIKKKEFCNRDKVIFIVLSIGAIALLGYLMLKK